MRRYSECFSTRSKAVIVLRCLVRTHEPRWRWGMAEAPPVPLTIEGSAVLHQMFRFKWREWRSLPGWHKHRIADDALRHLRDIEKGSAAGHPNQSGVYSQLGHKGDLML